MHRYLIFFVGLLFLGCSGSDSQDSDNDLVCTKDSPTYVGCPTGQTCAAFSDDQQACTDAGCAYFPNLVKFQVENEACQQVQATACLPLGADSNNGITNAAYMDYEGEVLAYQLNGGAPADYETCSSIDHQPIEGTPPECACYLDYLRGPDGAECIQHSDQDSCSAAGCSYLTNVRRICRVEEQCRMDTEDVCMPPITETNNGIVVNLAMQYMGQTLMFQQTGGGRANGYTTCENESEVSPECECAGFAGSEVGCPDIQR